MSELGTSRNICQVSCSVFLNGSVSGFFIMAGLQGFEQKKTEVKMLFWPRHVKSACCQHDWWPSVVLLIIWLGQCLPGIWEVFLFPLFSYCRFWKEATVHRSGRPCPTQLRAEYLYQFFVILLHDRFVYSLPFIYLLNHLSILISTHRFVLYFMLLFNTAFFFSNSSSFVHWVPFQFDSCAISVLWIISFPFFLPSFFPFFLTVWYYKMLQTCIFPPQP